LRPPRRRRLVPRGRRAEADAAAPVPAPAARRRDDRGQEAPVRGAAAGAGTFPRKIPALGRSAGCPPLAANLDFWSLPMRYRRRGRRATALVYFPLMLFALLALAALVIDLGWARVTQRQMQTAVDAAALEGLRGENADAHDVAAWTFDDDFDLSA